MPNVMQMVHISRPDETARSAIFEAALGTQAGEMSEAVFEEAAKRTEGFVQDDVAKPAI